MPPRPPLQNRPAQKPEQLAESPVLHNYRAAGTLVEVRTISGQVVRGKILRICRWTVDLDEGNGKLSVWFKHSLESVTKAA
jgi:hypothetical protein